MSTESSSQRRSRVTWYLMGAVLFWGLLLAVGAVGRRLDLVDPRRGLIVLVSVLAFCGLWLAAVRSMAPGRLPSTPTPRSRSALISLVLSGAGLAVWLAVLGGWFANPVWATSLAWLALAAMGGGLVGSIIALSDPRPNTGKGWALVTWLLVGVAVAGWIWHLQRGWPIIDSQEPASASSAAGQVREESPHGNAAARG